MYAIRSYYVHAEQAARGVAHGRDRAGLGRGVDLEAGRQLRKVRAAPHRPAPAAATVRAVPKR